MIQIKVVSLANFLAQNVRKLEILSAQIVVMVTSWINLSVRLVRNLVKTAKIAQYVYPVLMGISMRDLCAIHALQSVLFVTAQKLLNAQVAKINIILIQQLA